MTTERLAELRDIVAVRLRAVCHRTELETAELEWLLRVVGAVTRNDAIEAAVAYYADLAGEFASDELPRAEQHMLGIAAALRGEAR